MASDDGHLDENRASAFFSGQLDGAGVAAVETHVDQCNECRTLLSELARTFLARASNVARPSEPGSVLEGPRIPVSGDAVGRYVIIERIGAGGMGLVYSAYDPELGRRVAVKVLRHTARTDPTEKRLLREAQLLARLVHPNVVTVYDVGTIDGQLFLAMELVDGGTVYDWLRTEPRSWRQIRDVFVDAGRGLEAAHQAGVVHRDFKPENVLVGTNGRVCVTDFGLSRAPGDDATASSPSPSPPWPSPGKLTETGAVLGTPAYMAPEQRNGVADERSDQYSFCVALSEALDGKLPAAQGLPPVLAHSGLAPVPVPKRIRRAVERGLSANPADRFPTMHALLHALAWDPLVQRRRLTVGAVALLLLLVTAGAVGRSVLQSRACAGGPARWASVLPAARRDQLVAMRDRRVASVNPALKEEERSRWGRFLSALDDYQRAWLASYTDACEATVLRRDQSAELLDVRMGCLDARLASGDAFANLLERGDQDIELELDLHGSALLPIADCNDRAELNEPQHLPPDPAARARVTALRRQVASATTLEFGGALKEARAGAIKAVAEARAVGYKPALAEALNLVGDLERTAADGAAAERAYTEAALVAEASRSDTQAAAARVALTFVVGSLLDRPADGRKLVPEAQAAIDRIGAERGAELQLVLLNFRSTIAETDHHWDEARALLTQELALVTTANDPAHRRERGATENNFGVLEQRLEHGKEARIHFDRALAIEEPFLGAHHPSVLQVRLNRANLDPATAGAEISLLLPLYDELYGVDQPPMGNFLGSYANVLLCQPETRARAPRCGLTLAANPPGPPSAESPGGHVAARALRRVSVAHRPRRRGRAAAAGRLGIGRTVAAARRELHAAGVRDSRAGAARHGALRRRQGRAGSLAGH